MPPTSSAQPRIAASIVTYLTDRDELSKCVVTLRQAIDQITIIDNSPSDALRAFCSSLGVEYIYPGRNLGYGAAHNIALRRSLESGTIAYHLVINSDVWFGPDTIPAILSHMDANTDIGQLIPRTLYPDGKLQPVVRMLPTPFDLIFRRFLPKSWFRLRNKRYLLEFWDHLSEANIPYHQGSFMFLRTEALKQTGLFDERFFMYPEDIDLTRRIHRHFRTVYWPGTTIIHAHRASSYKSLRMLRIHTVNMIRYFNKWGWFIDPERRRFNRQLLHDLLASKK